MDKAGPSNFAVGLGIGLGAGVFIGMLLAPKSGRKTRQLIRSSAAEGEEYLPLTPEGGNLAITIGQPQVNEDLRGAVQGLPPGKYFGDILVQATPAGSRISIFLAGVGRQQVVASPRDEALSVTPEQAEGHAAAPEAAPALETILVVDDKGGIRALVRKILHRHGYTVLEASSAEEATKICQELSGRINLLMMDVKMLRMSGGTLVDTLIEECGGMNVLYVSGYDDDASINAGDFPPGTAFLQKPFTLDSLLDKVQEVLRPNDQE